MATYKADKAQDDYRPKASLGLNSVSFSYTVTTALAASDVVQLVKVPKGAKIVGGWITSNGTQSGSDAVCTIGDGADTDRFLLAAVGTFLRSGTSGSQSLTAQTGMAYQYEDEDTIDLLVTTVGTGQTTGGIIKGVVNYVLDDGY